MEQRRDVVKADQCRLSRRRFGNVEYIQNHRLLIQHMVLYNERAHPGTSPFRPPFEQIQIEESQLRAILIKHIKGPHIGVIDRQILPLLEGDSVELIHRIEDAVLNDSIDRKSTRLNSSHVATSYAVFCLNKKTADSD